MNTEQERAAFEAACRKHAEESGYDVHERLERNGDGYADLRTQAAWWGWREGLAAPQSQDRDGAIQAAINKLSAMTPRPPKAITYDHGWEIIDVVQRELCPAIDHARRAEAQEHLEQIKETK